MLNLRWIDRLISQSGCRRFSSLNMGLAPFSRTNARRREKVSRQIPLQISELLFNRPRIRNRHYCSAMSLPATSLEEPRPTPVGRGFSLFGLLCRRADRTIKYVSMKSVIRPFDRQCDCRNQDDCDDHNIASRQAFKHAPASRRHLSPFPTPRVVSFVSRFG